MLKPAKRLAKALIDSLPHSKSADPARNARSHISRADLVAGLARLGLAQGAAGLVPSSL